MSDRPGNQEKRTPDCLGFGEQQHNCPNIEETGGGFDGEQYRCAICGYAYYLDYEDMK
jgi:hypothetical protein